MTPPTGRTTSRVAAVIPPARTPAKAFPRSIQSPCCTCTARHLGTTATTALPERRRRHAYTHHAVVAPPSLRQPRTTSAAGPPPRPALGAASTPPGKAAARHHHGTAGEATRKPPRPQHHAAAGLHAVAPHAVAMQTPRRAAVAPHSQLADRSRAATSRCRTFSQLRSRPHAQMRPRSLGRCHLQCPRAARRRCRPRTRNHRISLARLNFLTQDHAKK